MNSRVAKMLWKLSGFGPTKAHLKSSSGETYPRGMTKTDKEKKKEEKKRKLRTYSNLKSVWARTPAPLRKALKKRLKANAN